MLIRHELEIPREFVNRRLDQVIADLLPQYSRARLQHWIKEGALTVDGQRVRPREKIHGGEKISLAVEVPSESDEAEDIPLEVVYEDNDLLVVNKPAGLVVHPGAGNPRGTLLNALLNHAPAVASVPRAGIVHRLDKETSGLLVVAKNLSAQNYLVQQIQARQVTRIYDALVYGVPNHASGSVDGAIGRHPVHRKKMALRSDGKQALTHWRVRQQFREHALLECRLDTGRTHQIRVHMSSIGHPLVGDLTYGGHYRRPKLGDDWLDDALRDFRRQALHARKLGLIHPVSGRAMSWQADRPEDLSELLDLLDD